MPQFIQIEGSGLASFILAHLLHKYSDISFHWEWLSLKNNFPIFLDTQVLQHIKSFIPEIEDICENVDVTFNSKKFQGNVFWKWGYKWLERWQYHTDHYIVSTLSPDFTYTTFQLNIPPLKFFSIPKIFAHWYYEFFDGSGYPYYVFSFQDMTYLAYYSEKNVSSFVTENNITFEKQVVFEFTSGLTYIDTSNLPQNIIPIASWIWITPFFLWLWNIVAFIDVLLTFLYIETGNMQYKELLYTYRKDLSVKINITLRENPYIIQSEKIEKHLYDLLWTIMKKANAIIQAQ